MIDNSVSLYMSCQLNCYPLSDEPSKSEVLASLLEIISVKKKAETKKGVTTQKRKLYVLISSYNSPAY